jgi:hypothetical protein
MGLRRLSKDSADQAVAGRSFFNAIGRAACQKLPPARVCVRGPASAAEGRYGEVSP